MLQAMTEEPEAACGSAVTQTRVGNSVWLGGPQVSTRRNRTARTMPSAPVSASPAAPTARIASRKGSAFSW